MKKRLWPLVLMAGTMIPVALQAQDGTETAQERSDRGLIVGFIEDNLSSAGRQVTLRGFEGALSSRATASQLTIADDEGIWLTLNDIVLDWNRSALLGGRVEVSELIAGEIIVARAPVTAADDSIPSPEAQGFSLPDLPVSVQISKLSAPKVVLGESLIGQPVEGAVEASVMLSGGEGTGKLSILRKDSGPNGQIDLAASYSNSSNVLQIDLTAVEDADGIAANLLNLPGKPSVDLRLKGDGPLDSFAADVVLKTDGTQRLIGALALDGDEAGLKFTGDIRGDMAPLFAPDYAEFLGNALSLKVEGVKTPDGALDLSQLDLKARVVDLQGRLLLAADGMPSLIDLSGQMRDPDGKPIAIPGADGVQLQSGRLQLDFNAAESEYWQIALEGDGVETEQLSARRLDLQGAGRIARETSGRVVDGSLTMQSHGLELRDPALAQALGRSVQGSADFLWQDETGRLQIPNLRLSAGPVELDAQAEIFGFEESLRITSKAQLFASDLRPLSALVGQPLAGRANISLTASGSPLAGDFDVQAQVAGQDMAVGITELDNLLKGAASANVDLVRDANGTVLRNLQLRADGLEVDGNGRIDSANSAMNLTLAMDNLGRLGATYGGSVAGRVTLDGPITTGRAHLVADLNTTDLKLGVAQVDGLLAGKAQLSAEGDVDGNILQLKRLDLAAPTATIAANGRLSLEDSNIDARFDLRDLSRLGAGFAGAIKGEGSFIGSQQNAKVTLKADANGLRVGQPEADKLLAGASRLEGALQLENGVVRVEQVTLNNPQLSVDAKGRLADGLREVQLNGRLANLGLLLPEFPGPVTLSGSAVDRGNGYELALQGSGPGQIDARVNGTIAANFASANLSVQGSAQAGLANPFLGTRVVSGPVSMDLRVNGPLALSSVSGQVRLARGRVIDPSLPFTLENLDATAALSGGRLQLDASTQLSSGGRVTVSGPVSLSAPFNGDLRLALQRAVVRDPNLYEATVNGDLRINGPLTGGAAISGTIDLITTEIRIASTGISGQEMIDGLRHLRDTAPVRETRRRAQIGTGTQGDGASGDGTAFGLNILVSAPNQVFIRGRGLDAELGGTLRLSGTTKDVIPSGGFELIRGRLDILGRRLDLTGASLQLEGDFDARLRIVATSVNDGISSSVVIEGSASDPQVSFTSQPELPEEEVLAQLLFGRRLDSLSALQALQLANAVATLAGKGGDGIVSNLRQGFGLDDLDVGTDSEGNAQLKAGKYLSENVYSEVAVDGKGQTQINLNLDLTDNVTVKAKVGADGDTGLGIFYERDY